jgi:DNA-binding MarR family transcriptional regulator
MADLEECKRAASERGRERGRNGVVPRARRQVLTMEARNGEYQKRAVDPVISGSATRAVILGILANSGPATPAEITDKIGVPAASTQYSIRALHLAGYVEVNATTVGLSRPTRVIDITPQGRAALTKHARQLASFAGIAP